VTGQLATAPAWLANPSRDAAWTCPAPPAEVRDFHRGLSGYAPTALVDLPALARELGVGRVLAKDESDRLGLPAFKALGASWAIHRALRGVAGTATVVTATDGNHGRAVARFAHRLGHRARIFVPDGVHPAAVAAIRAEGAEVTHVPGDYDAAVRAAAEDAAAGGVLVQDTAWPGYEEVPGWIVDGYATLFAEVDEQLGGRGRPGPDVVLVPTGVGSLLQAALAHYRGQPARPGTAVVSVEPVGAACVRAALVAGGPVTIPTGRTVMAGLNCGTMSSLAWPFVQPGLDGSVVVTDAGAAAAARDLAAHGVPAGPCGAAPLAAARTLAALGAGPLTRDATVVLLVSEGAAANPVLVEAAPA
jgi:diaminopropionate ammonia-lyase